MRPDPASTLPHARHGRETQHARPTARSERARREGLGGILGVYVGIAVGLAFWVGVIALCALVAATT